MCKLHQNEQESNENSCAMMLAKYPGATLDHIQNATSPRIKFYYPCCDSKVIFDPVTGDVKKIEEHFFYICRECLLISKGKVWRTSETHNFNCPIHKNLVNKKQFINLQIFFIVITRIKF